MRQRLFKKHRQTRRSVTTSAAALQMHQRVQTFKRLPRRFATMFGQHRLPYCMCMLLATIIVSVLDWSMLQALLPVGSILFIRLRQAVHWLKRWPCRVATALRQPHVQYRLMLLLAMLLALLIGWSTFFSVGLRPVLVFGAGRM